MLTLVITSLAAGHGASAAYLIRKFQRQPRPRLRQWQAASLIFPFGVLVALWLAKDKG